MLNLGTGKFLSNDFIIDIGASAAGPIQAIESGGGSALVVWKRTNNTLGARVVPFKMFGGDPILHGQNNFFTAPLIERDYDVRARIKLEEQAQ